jgi:hypothetical protein
MSTSEAEVTLLINARNLSDRVVKDFGRSLTSLADHADRAGGRIKGAFNSVSSGITNGLGNLTENLAQGAGLGESMFMFGAYMAGQAAESMVGGLLERFASSSLLAALGAPLAAAGSAVGSVLAAAIPVGMALLPVLLVAALVAAIVFLINNPEIVDRILEFAGGVVDFIIDGLVALPGMLLDFFGAAWQGVVDAVGPFVGAIVDFFLGIPGQLVELGANIVATIIDGLVSLPGKIADVIRNAFANLRIDVGPFHITGKGITIDLPKIDDPNVGKGGAGNATGKASGGWVGLHGPELIRAGELGPEYVRKAGTGTGDGGGIAGTPAEIAVYLDGRKIARVVDRHLFYDMRRAAPTTARV